MTTHTCVTMEVSQSAWDEIAEKLRAAGYDHAFDGKTIDMHGIALEPKGEAKRDLKIAAVHRWFWSSVFGQMRMDKR